MRIKISSDRHDYRLDVTLANWGGEPIDKWHVDVEVPAQIAEQPRTSVLYVPERSSFDVAFFRASDRNHLGPIWPGDTKLVASVEYFVDKDIFWNPRDLFQRRVRATLYRPGFQPVTLEKFVGDLQVF